MKAETLKKSILQYAMEGKLVPQDPNDEPASELLKRIKAEKEQLIKEGKIKKDKTESYIFKGEDNKYYEQIGSKTIDITDEIPFEIPQGWEWARLGNIVNYGSTGSVEYSSNLDENTWILDLEDIEKTSSKLLIKHRVAERIFNSTKKSFKKGDVLYGKLRPYLDKVIVADEDGICTTEILPLRAFGNLNPFYLRYVLKNPTFLHYVNQLPYGVKMPRLGTEDGKNALIPIPPLVEQQRIVDKLEQILPLIDEYKINEEKLSKLNETLPAKIKQSILQHAVQGKLVEQDPNDEPASELLKRIKAEKEQLIKEGKIKKDKTESYIYKGEDNNYYEQIGSKTVDITDEIPFEIPQGWEWVRLRSILLKLTDGTHHTPKYTSSGVPFLSVKDMSSGKLNFNNTKFISQEEHAVLYKRCNPEKGDLLVTKVGTTGVPVIVDTDKEFSLFVSVALLKFNNNFLNIKFLYYLILSPLVKEQAKANTKGIGNQNWVIDKIANTLITIPPLLEQQRIVNKIEELLNLCNTLK